MTKRSPPDVSAWHPLVLIDIEFDRTSPTGLVGIHRLAPKRIVSLVSEPKPLGDTGHLVAETRSGRQALLPDGMDLPALLARRDAAIESQNRLAAQTSWQERQRDTRLDCRRRSGQKKFKRVHKTKANKRHRYK